MFLFRTGTIRAAVLAVAGIAGVSAANAEQGKFTLPFEAHWGQVVLAPGEYTITVPNDVTWSKVMQLSGAGKTVFVMSGFDTSRPFSDNSFLVVKNVNGTHYVREFASGFSGRSFRFAVPKGVRREVHLGAMTQDAQVAVNVRH